MQRRGLLFAVPAFTLAALGAAPALADAPTSISANWAGYEITPASYSSSGFSAVSGSWVQPTANCSGAGQTYVAFWVGLGGGAQSQALEQVGTQADCTGSGQASYIAWYELVPSAPVQLSLQVNPGDKIDASVHVNGASVTVWLTDEMTGGSFSKTLQMSSPDTSSAEWIAEAPSACPNGASGSCTPMPLTDFGTVNFTNTSATSDGYTGTIGDASFSAQSLALDPSQDGVLGTGSGYGAASSAAATGSTAGAQPSSLSSDGHSFSVSYSPNGVGASSTSSSDGAGGYGATGGYGAAGGYGAGGYGSGGSDSGYGGSGYGGSGYGYGYGNAYGGGDPYGGGGYGLPGLAYLLGY
jgi:hypothetical protein